MKKPELYKSVRQQEFCALLTTLQNADPKIRDTDVASRIGKTRGAISQYKSGYSQPSKTVLMIMRQWVEEIESPKEETVPSVKELRDQLADLERLAPADYQVARTIIISLHQKLPMVINSGSPSGAVENAARGAAPGAMAKALASERKQRAAAPSEDKDAPKPGAAPAKK